MFDANQSALEHARSLIRNKFTGVLHQNVNLFSSIQLSLKLIACA